MMDWQPFIVGAGYIVALLGAAQFGWQQAMAFCEKLEHFHVSVEKWRAYGRTEEPSEQPTPQVVQRFDRRVT